MYFGKKVTTAGLILIASSSFSACSLNSSASIQNTWKETEYPEIPDVDDPKFMVPNANRQFSQLPLSGSTDDKHMPWSESYFANIYGGVAKRWQQPGTDAWTYVPPTREQVAAMSYNEIRSLSALEKFDIYRGRFDYPLLKMERARVSKDDPAWAGLCNQWTAVSLSLPEPEAVDVIGSTGVKIQFASSDVKALYMYNQKLQDDAKKTTAAYIGSRCNTTIYEAAYNSDPGCNDLNPGAFHIALTNLIGIQKVGFIAELDRSQEIWNHPVFGFRSKVLGQQTLASGNSLVKISTTIKFATEAGSNRYSVIGTASQRIKEKTYDYYVELNPSGTIVGGEWISQDEKPDFLWSQPLAEIAPELQGLNKLYRAAIPGLRPYSN